MHRHPPAGAKLLDGPVRPTRHQPLGGVALQSLDLAQAEAQRPVFQCAVPVAFVHIDRAHLNTVLARVADDLGGGVEAHRLGVKQPAAKAAG